jgi:hypothetical protein
MYLYLKVVFKKYGLFIAKQNFFRFSYTICMDREKELKFKKVLAYHLSRGIITKKKYKKELEFIKQLKNKNDK